ncbi:hypothetical protein SAMN04487965_2009 [Microbulbifer donghaiensis]|uniref:Tetratricopeptide repeat-containing protein n=1 Tax=Microbulbifer donghaiensis TaxID=494016 RepID=A0A1M5AY97_9GAMM|nr:tetratricopeptide repeat protein [Microbulbifer donghaiensis]SHF35261.1 hypothetical protein SAMN04487965_2009 [Microbulbifer donghaiensis]
MKLRFLCANHRQWLTADSGRAEQAWLDWVERGATLCEEGNHAEAIPLLGCAFDLASFLLGEHWPGYAVAAVRFSDTARQLMAAYRRNGESGPANYILVGASSLLARELHDRRNYQVTADCIRTLYAGQPHAAAPQPWPKDSAGARRLH